jgi:hypothetical protein
MSEAGRKRIVELKEETEELKGQLTSESKGEN